MKERWWTGGIYLAGAGLIVPQQSTVKNGDSTECHSQPPFSIYVLLLQTKRMMMMVIMMMLSKPAPLYICAAATDEGDDDDSCYWLFMKRL